MDLGIFQCIDTIETRSYFAIRKNAMANPIFLVLL
jgi:hypothetical protein